MVVPISHIQSGDSGHIIWIASNPEMKKRLKTRGIVPNTTIRYAFHVPPAKIIGCLANGRLLLLRRKIANEIFIELDPP